MLFKELNSICVYIVVCDDYKFLYLYFKDKDDRLSSRKLRYSELVIESLREL